MRKTSKAMSVSKDSGLDVTKEWNKRWVRHVRSQHWWFKIAWHREWNEPIRTQSLGTWSALGASDWLPISVEMFRPIANRHVSESRPNRPIPNSYSFSHFLDLPFINYQIRNKNSPVFFCFKRPFLSLHSHFQEIEPGWLTRSSDTTLSQRWKEAISFFKTRLSLPPSL